MVVRDGNGEMAVCAACVDRAFPRTKLGAMRRHFHRDRSSSGQCPYCGWTQEQLDRRGLVGCPLCYEALVIAKD